MVAKFRTVGDARAYLDALLPGWRADAGEDEPYPAAWNELFLREQVAGVSMSRETRSQPDELVRVGCSVLAGGYGLGDNFPELRALAWKRGARVLPGGIHVHEPSHLFGAIAARDESDRDGIVQAAGAAGMEAFIHGRTVFVPAPSTGTVDASLTAQAERLLALADGRPVAAETCPGWTKADLVHALARLGRGRPARPRLWIRFHSAADGPGDARRFAATLDDQQVTLGSNWLLVDPVLGRKRVAVLAHRREAEVTALDAESVGVQGYFWLPPPPPRKGTKAESPPMPTAAELQEALRRQGPALRDATTERRDDHDDALSVDVTTPEPGRVLAAMERAAEELGLSLWLSLSDPEPTLAMLARLREDLGPD